MALSPVYPENKTQFPNAIVNSVSFMSTTNIARELGRRIQLMDAVSKAEGATYFSPSAFSLATPRFWRRPRNAGRPAGRY